MGGKQTRTEVARPLPGCPQAQLVQGQLRLGPSFPAGPGGLRPGWQVNSRRLTRAVDLSHKSGAADVATSAAPSHPPVSYEPGAICMLLAPLADAYPGANQPKDPTHKGERAHPWYGISSAARVAVSRSQAGVSQLAPVPD